MFRIQFLLIAIMVVIAFWSNFDYVSFSLKTGDKRAMLPKIVWHFGFILDVILLYWYMNGYKFV